MTNPISDVLKSEVILITGTNTTENHPIIANYVYEAVSRNGAKLIVVDPRRINMVDHSTLWLKQNPGTDVAWINGMMHIILKENLQDQAYIDERTEDLARASFSEDIPTFSGEVMGSSEAKPMQEKSIESTITIRILWVIFM